MSKAAKARKATTRPGANPRRQHSPRISRRSVRARQRRRGPVTALIVAGLAVAALAAIFFLSNGGNSSAGDRSAYPFEVGEPGPGKTAPPIRLPSTDGSMFDLASARGETVLLFFQEGLMCRPCWDQIKDIEADWDKFQLLGIDRMVSITTDPLDLLKQKVKDERITTPILSDPDVAVSRAYTTNLYGMMGTTMNGHSFIVVDETGLIRWRADYGGAPKYTMYVPMDRLLADLREGLTPQEETYAGTR